MQEVSPGACFYSTEGQLGIGQTQTRDGSHEMGIPQFLPKWNVTKKATFSRPSLSVLNREI